MSWIQIIIGVIAIARELLKIIKDVQDDKREVNLKLKEMRKALKRAREEGKSDEVEKLFKDLLLSYSDTNKLQDSR